MYKYEEYMRREIALLEDSIATMLNDTIPRLRKNFEEHQKELEEKPQYIFFDGDVYDFADVVALILTDILPELQKDVEDIKKRLEKLKREVEETTSRK